MIKPSSGGVDMVEVFRDMFGNTHEYYRVRIKELEQLNDTIRNDYNEGLKRIKGLENDLTAFIDETNRLTVIKKELERALDIESKWVKHWADKVIELEQELERYKEFEQRIKAKFPDIWLMNFEEAKE